MVGARRRARAVALQALYEVDSVGHEVEGVVNQLLAREGCLRKMPTSPVSW